MAWPPVIVGALLVGAIVVQIAAPAPPPPPSSSDMLAAPRAPRMPIATPVPDYPAILAAPIFAPDRRTGEAGGGSADDLQLIGVAVSSPGSGSAVLRAADGATHVLRRGDSLNGLRLAAVGADRVVLTGATGSVRLMLGAPAKSAPAAQPAASVTP